jgi:hypothetical protein
MLTTSRYTKPTLKKLNAISIPTQLELVHMFYDVSMYGKKGKKESTWDKSVKTIKDNNVFLVGDNEDMPRKKNAYMKHLFKHFYAISRKDYTPSQIKLIIEKITPDKSTTSSKTIFKQFRELQKDAQQLVEGRSKRYSSITVPTGFTVSQTKYDPNYELVVGHVTKYNTDRLRHKITDLESCKATFFYGTADDEEVLKEYKALYECIFNASETRKFAIGNSYGGYPVRFVVMAKSNIKYIAEMKNFKPLSEAVLMFQRKREKVVHHIEKTKFTSAYGSLNHLFLNEKLFSVIDSKYSKVIIELKKLYKTYNSGQKMSLYYGDGSFAKKVFKIKEDQVKFQGENLIKIVSEKAVKNGLMKFVSVSNDFDPKNSHYSEKDSADVMQLLDLIYVK